MELQHYFEPAAPGQAVQAVPGAGLNVPLWILGSSLFGAQLAAALGLPYAFASHFAPAQMRSGVEIYRRQFRPSAQLDKPHVMLGLNVFVADTDSEARRLFTSVQQQFINLRRGTPGKLQPPIEDPNHAWSASDRIPARSGAVPVPGRLARDRSAGARKLSADPQARRGDGDGADLRARGAAEILRASGRGAGRHHGRGRACHGSGVLTPRTATRRAFAGSASRPTISPQENVDRLCDVGPDFHIGRPVADPQDRLQQVRRFAHFAEVHRCGFGVVDVELAGSHLGLEKPRQAPDRRIRAGLVEGLADAREFRADRQHGPQMRDRTRPQHQFQQTNAETAERRSEIRFGRIELAQLFGLLALFLADQGREQLFLAGRNRRRACPSTRPPPGQSRSCWRRRSRPPERPCARPPAPAAAWRCPPAARRSLGRRSPGPAQIACIRHVLLPNKMTERFSQPLN